MALPLRLLRPMNRRPRQLQKCLFATTKSYHSYDHPPAPPYPPAQSTILTAALHRVPDHGFTDKSLTLGAQDAGYLPISTNLFPRGVFELVLFYLVQRRMALQGAVNGEGNAGLQQVWDDMKLGVGGRVRGLVLERLKMNSRERVVGRWQEVCSILFSIHSSGLWSQKNLL
jgi:ubiquinone biosynthesis protein COQ9